MTERQSLIAFGMILFAICYLASVAAILAWNKRYVEALGFGGLTTGLVGVLGTFKPRSNSPDQPQAVNVINPPSDPVPTTTEPQT